jgi:hypothetical protein
MTRRHELPDWRGFMKRPLYRIESLRSEMACHRTCHPGGGGAWSGKTGDGEAWRCNDRVWAWKRQIKAGQWAGPWVRVLAAGP